MHSPVLFRRGVCFVAVLQVETFVAVLLAGVRRLCRQHWRRFPLWFAWDLVREIRLMIEVLRDLVSAFVYQNLRNHGSIVCIG